MTQDQVSNRDKKNPTINTREQILDWARETSAANGEKYTVLTKDAQLAIARFIQEHMQEIANLQKRDVDTDVENTISEKSMDWNAKDASVASASIPAENPSKAPHIMRRADCFRSKGLDAQAVYEKFLEWKSTYPTKAVVMDFSNGEKVDSAAFAYWLTEFVA